MADKGSINDLGLGNDKLEGAEFDQIPDNLGQPFAELLQPGKYRFKLPNDLGTVWAKVDSEKHGERIQAIFDNDNPLRIVQSPGGTRDGEDFTTRISNVPRERTKEKILVSDMDLLLRALGNTKRPTTNKAYAQALITYAGKEFGANIELSWSCRSDKDGYWDDGTGNAQQVEGRPGCGARYYQRDVAKGEDGKFPERITCSNPECGASVRAFANLGGFSK